MSDNDNYVIVHYGELRLKGRNRVKFENALIDNIKEICGGSVEKLGSSLICKNSDIGKFKYVSGISSYAPCIKIDKDYDKLVEYFNNLNVNTFDNKKSFRVKVKRSDRKFKYNSVEIGREIGSIIYEKTGLDVDLKNSDITVYIEINEYILVYMSRYVGMGGFPAGIHGNLLCLLSGGIDSPVAAYSMIRKGCHVDLVHFHVFSNNDEVYRTKIIEVGKTLNQYQKNTKLYLVPSYVFDFSILDNTSVSGYEMILFRRFIHKIAQIICDRDSYKAIVNGDSLGQVASQTIENLYAVRKDLNTLLLQPLIALDKQEVIDQAKSIGTYELSIQQYKDCCSIISKKPVTRANVDKIKDLEESIGINKVIVDTLKLIECKTIAINISLILLTYFMIYI